MKKTSYFAKYLFVLFTVAMACNEESITEVPVPLQKKTPLLSKEENEERASISQLYADFTRVLRDIEIEEDIMSYPEFEKALRETNSKERDLLKREIKEAMSGMDENTRTGAAGLKLEGNCKSNVVSRETSSRIKSLGRSRARINWSNKARSRYGWKYRKWSKAKDRGYYHYTDGTDFLLWKYRAYGKPCK